MDRGNSVRVFISSIVVLKYDVNFININVNVNLILQDNNTFYLRKKSTYLCVNEIYDALYLSLSTAELFLLNGIPGHIRNLAWEKNVRELRNRKER